MDEFFREIQEDIQRERYALLWKRYGNFIVGLALAVVIGTAAGVAYRSYQKSEHEKATAALYFALNEAIEQNNPEKLMEMAKGSGAYAMLASLYSGEELERASKTAEADQLYKTAAERGAKTHPALAGVNALHAGDMALNAGPFSHIQAERRAWQLVAEGKKAEAKAAFEALNADSALPASARQRIEHVIAYVEAKK